MKFKVSKEDLCKAVDKYIEIDGRYAQEYWPQFIQLQGEPVEEKLSIEEFNNIANNNKELIRKATRDWDYSEPKKKIEKLEVIDEATEDFAKSIFDAKTRVCIQSSCRHARKINELIQAVNTLLDKQNHDNTR